MRGRDPVAGLHDDASEKGRVQRCGGIVEMVEHRERVRHADPAGRRHRGQGLAGARAE
jgi:hypothetical protein